MRDILKQSLIYCLWNLYIWTVIWVEGVIGKHIWRQLAITTELKWTYLGVFVELSMWLLVGLGISWLISNKSIYGFRQEYPCFQTWDELPIF